MKLSPFLRRRSFRTLLRSARQRLFGKRGQRRVQGWRLFYRLRMQVMLRSPRRMRDLATAVRVRVWVDYDESFRRLHRLIHRANHTVFIQMFIWKDDAVGRGMAELLLQVADRGVRVEIRKEAVGDVFELHRDFLTTREDGDPLWQRFWTHPNIRVTYGHHNDHAKVYIIDDRILLLTGMNLAEEQRKWHDYMVELRGAGFVSRYLTQGELPNPSPSVRLVMNTESAKEIRPAIMQLLQGARSSILLEHCYVSDPQVMETLIRRSKQGVRVTVIIPEHADLHHNANMQAIAQLLAEGDARRLQVFVYPKMFHAKVMLIDRHTVFVGSANLMTSSIDEMGEVNVLLRRQAEPALRKIRDVLREDILHSKPLTSPPRLSWLSRWLAWVKL